MAGRVIASAFGAANGRGSAMKRGKGVALSEKARELLSQGGRLTLVGLSPNMAHFDSGWPRTRDTHGRVVAIVSPKPAATAEECFDHKVAQAFFIGRRPCSRKRPQKTRKAGGFGMRSGRMMMGQMTLHLRTQATSAGGEAPAFCAFISYGMPKRQRVRKRGVQRGIKRILHDNKKRKIKETRTQAIMRERAMKSIRRRNKQKSGNGSDSWHRAMRSCERAIAQAHPHSETLPDPTPAQVKRWSDNGGLAAAAGYLLAQAQAAAIAASVKESSAGKGHKGPAAERKSSRL